MSVVPRVNMMNACIQSSNKITFHDGLFHPHITQLSRAALLKYFQQRNTVQFFTREDSYETSNDKMEALLDNIFEFNGEKYKLAADINWLDNPSDDIEWHIMLHKFYYAVGLGRRFHETGDRRYLDKWVSLCSSWMEQTPVGFIAADVTGRRVQNWVYAYFYFVHQHPEVSIPAEFHYAYLRSLAKQVRFLCNNLHPARNHRTLELYAIFQVAIVFSEFAHASHWSSFALQEIIKNIDSDLLDDGVQCELSTDYHHIVLRNYLFIRRLAQLNGIAFPAVADRKLVKALEFAMHAHKPDGLVPSLSDGDVDSYLSVLALGAEIYQRDDMAYVASGGECGKQPDKCNACFEQSGYYIVRSDWQKDDENYHDARYLIFDCGPLGAGNHGHLDLLNFEAAAYGRSLIVDPGRYTYSEAGETNWRVLFRSTEYHNTVQVDGLNQTKYIAGKKRFKINGSKAQHIFLGRIHYSDYDLLAGRATSSEYNAIHERHLHFIDQRYWVCFDQMVSVSEHQYDLRFHLNSHAHNKTCLQVNAGGSRVDSPNLLLISPDNQSESTQDNGFVSTRYGEKQNAPVIRYRLNASTASFHTVLMPYKESPPNIEVSSLPAHCTSNSYQLNSNNAVVIRDNDNNTTDLCFSAAGLAVGGWQFTCQQGNPFARQFDGWQFHGTSLFVRIDDAGNILILRTDNAGRVCYRGKKISAEFVGAAVISTTSTTGIEK
jgi:hypothetical protein